MKNILNLILLIFLSILINIIGIFSFGSLFITVIEKLMSSLNVDIQNILFVFYLGVYFFLNLALTYLTVIKKGANKLFYVHIPISLLAIIPLFFYIGAFFR